MRRHGFAWAFLCLALLAGCNTPETLTPQAEIPNAGDSAQQEVATDRRTVRNETADNTAQPVEVASNTYPPQNTLEAQAAALERGEPNPSLTKPDENATLGANLYKTNPAVKPVNSLYAASASKDSIRFLPIIGAPVAAVTPLSRELGNSARSNGLTIKRSTDETAEHVLKGYLSAFSDGKKVTVVYVWDVLDNAGARLHRIQGQEAVGAKGSDAWSSVPPEVMQQIGTSTIAEYLRWKQAQG